MFETCVMVRDGDTKLWASLTRSETAREAMELMERLRKENPHLSFCVVDTELDG